MMSTKDKFMYVRLFDFLEKLRIPCYLNRKYHWDPSTGAEYVLWTPRDRIE